MHANGWDCGESSLSGNCNHYEYGNTFDTMGEPSYSLHFNAFYKELLGWITPDKEINITSSGRYTLNSLEQSNSAKQLAKIKILGFPVTPLYLEYRKGLGFDRKLNDENVSSNQQGLFVNRIVRSNTFMGYPHVRLLDMSPTTDTWYDDSVNPTLNDQASFSDPSRGIHIGPVVQVTPNSIQFDTEIVTPVCSRGNPVVGIGSAGAVTRRSENVVWVDYGNGDSVSCGSSDFRVTTDIPTSWQPEITPDRVSSAPSNDEQATTLQKTITFTIPNDLPFGVYYPKVTVVNLTSGLVTYEPFTVEVYDPVVITNASPVSGPVMSHVVINGSNFSTQPIVSVYGNYGWWWGNFNSSSNGSIVEFDFPERIYSNDCSPDCSLIDTPTGIYYLVVQSATGYISNPFQFEVTP